MTYTIKFSSNTKTPFTIAEYRYDGIDSKDGHHTSLTLVGKGTTDYGEELWTNLVHMLENHCSMNEPPRPIEGQLWYDNSFAGKLKILKKPNPLDVPSKWVEIIDKESLREYLRDPEFFPISRLAADVYVPRNGSTIHGILKVNGRLDAWGGIISRRIPVASNEVVTLGYLNNEINKFNGKYLPLDITKAGSTVTTGNKTLTISGNLDITGTTSVADPVNETDAVNLRSLNTTLRKTGFSWPTQKVNTVLTSDGNVPRFTDITPDYICNIKKSENSVVNNYSVIASDPSKETAYWLNLDNDYLYTRKGTSTAIQEIFAPKKFNDVTLNGVVKDGNGSPGTSGYVLTSQGAGKAPVWSPGGSANNEPATPTETTSTGTGTGVLTSDGTSQKWVDGAIGQFLSITGNSSYNWIDIISNMVQNEKAGSATTGYFTRGYLQLPNNLLLQWIIGKPIYDATTLAPAPVVTDWYSYIANTGDFTFLNIPSVDITCRYKFEVPFETIFFKQVSTSITALTVNNTVNVNSNGEYKILDSGSTNTHVSVTLQVPASTVKVRPLLSPVIFAVGKSPSADVVAPNRVVFETSGSWTVPAGAKNVQFELIGGGGGGAGGYTNDNWNAGGGGGGSGGYTLYAEPTAVAGDVYTIVVGTGGVGGTGRTQSNTPVMPSAGTTSYIRKGTNTLEYAYGGGVQIKVTSELRTNVGGVGGVGHTRNGFNGGDGKPSKDNGGATATAGKGGDCPIPFAAGLYAGGGAPGKLGGKHPLENGGNGVGYGAGGGGGSITGKGGKPGIGGKGHDGVVIVTFDLE